MTPVANGRAADGPRPIWLERYETSHPINRRGAFHLFSARRALDARSCVVIVPGTAAGAERAVATFAEIERVHALLDHPLIPKVSSRGVAGGTPYLELACDAVIDGVELYGHLLDAGRKVPHASTAGLIASLCEAMQAAHAVTDPRSGKPVCLGRISYANILFSPEGRWYWVGYGRNFPLERASGERDEGSMVFQALDVALGGAPTPTSDYVALALLGRSLLPVVKVSAAVARAFTANARPADVELLEHLRWIEPHVVSAPLGVRRSVEEAEAVMACIHALSDVMPDPSAFASFVASLLAARELPPLAADTAGAFTLVLGFELRWIIGVDGVQYPLGDALSRIVTALVDQHGDAPDASLSLQDLLEAGWPGERPVAEAGANRVYVALTQLRRMGLRDVIERSEHGYRLAPRTVVRRVAPSAGRARSRSRRRAR